MTNDKIRELYRIWTAGGQKSSEAIGELAELNVKTEAQIKQIIRG